jgi:DUF4097 and DUF4098 domain-containing protein YvlB
MAAQENAMEIGRRGSVLGATFVLALTTAAAQTNKQFRFPVSPRASINIANQFGPVTVRPSQSGQVLITARLHSNKVEVDASKTGNRVEVRSHVLQSASDSDAQVDYDVQVPPDTSVTIHCNTGPLTVQGLAADISLQSDTGDINAHDLSDLHLVARSVNGNISLRNIRNGSVEAASISGDVVAESVVGPKVNITGTKGIIRYAGDPGEGNQFSFSTSSGDIEVTLPAEASVDVNARSINGTVQNEFPLVKAPHTTLPSDAHSLAGTASNGSSVIRLRSLSGTIRVKKR